MFLDLRNNVNSTKKEFSIKALGSLRNIRKECLFRNHTVSAK